MSHLPCLLGGASLLSVSLNRGWVSDSGRRKLRWWVGNVTVRTGVRSSAGPFLRTGRGVLKRRVACAESAKRIFFEGTFLGFLKPSQDFFLCYVQLSRGVLISMSKIISFQFEGLGSVLFNDVV